VENRVTICLGTIQRPYCLQRFIYSVRANFPSIPIIVADQDKPSGMLESFYRHKGVRVIHVPEDAGVCASRNAAVGLAETEYVLICDDDFIFSNETSFAIPMEILDHDRSIDIVGGVVRDIVGPMNASSWRVRRWEHFFELDRKRRQMFTTMIDSFSPLRREVNGHSYFLADTVLNWKLVRKSAFARGARWDPRFKCNGEHNDFYINIKENTDIGVAYCPHFFVYHHSPQDFHYGVKRDNEEGFALLGEKWGIDEVLDVENFQFRAVLARGFNWTPQAETADPALVAPFSVVKVSGRTRAALESDTWPATQCREAPKAALNDLRVVRMDDETAPLEVKTGARFSLHVAVENKSDQRVGCLGPYAPTFSYRVRRRCDGALILARGYITPLNQDLRPGLTFHVVNVYADWDVDDGEELQIELDLLFPHSGWLNRHAAADVILEQPEGERRPTSHFSVDFRKQELPKLLLFSDGMSHVESWGRWSDANVANAVTLRFVDPLPRRFRMEIVCRAFGPNVNQPCLIEVGDQRQTIWPSVKDGLHALDFSVDKTAKTIAIQPALPSSPSSLNAGSDHRRLGVGLVELKIISDELSETNEERAPSAATTPSVGKQRAGFWDQLYAIEDPWNYRCAYEQQKYARTLEIMPASPIDRALEIGCAEGLFSEMLAPRVGSLLSVDISERALERARARCRRQPNVNFECRDVFADPPAGPFQLITCSEVLYYCEDMFALKKFAAKIVQALAPNGCLVMANANSVSDDRTTTGFDFSEIGAVFMGRIFAELPELEFIRELRTPCYRIQVFRRRTASEGDALTVEQRRLPREVIETTTTFSHPQLKWNGCVVTDAESRFLHQTPDAPILMYHRIAVDGPADLAPYRLDPAIFEQHLSHLQRYGYISVSPDEIWRLNAEPGKEPKPGKLVCLTFDDGYQDFADVAWPLLRRYGFTATVFLATDHVGGRSEWDSEYGEPAPLMDWETVQRLSWEGVSFGSHSCSHPALISLSREALTREVEESRRVLQAKIGTPLQGFCYPYTDHDSRVIEAVRVAGYDYALAGDKPEDEPRNAYALPRIEVRGDADLDTFVELLPPPSPSSPERQAEYRRLRSLRHCSTYWDV
jgi:peptidoglycan/xylan/chitin deacetylase (PgdA/CDA1 family)/glycosyltransferase involved in cell wall biosynthesis